MASTIVALAGQPGSCPVGDSAAFSACVSAQSDQARSAVITAAAIGVGGALIGGALVFAGIQTSPHPVDAAQMRALADQYNRQLREQLGLQLVPVATPDRAGIALDLRF